MGTNLVICRHCDRPDLNTYGLAPNGEQRYRCRTCGRQRRENPGGAAYAAERKAESLRTFQEHSSLRGLERTFGVARSTVNNWLKNLKTSSNHEYTRLASSARSNYVDARNR